MPIKYSRVPNALDKKRPAGLDELHDQGAMSNNTESHHEDDQTSCTSSSSHSSVSTSPSSDTCNSSFKSSRAREGADHERAAPLKSSLPLARHVIIHLLHLGITVTCWRGFWIIEDCVVGEAGLKSAIVSLVTGNTFLFLLRYSPWLSNILPVQSGASFWGKCGRYIFLMVMIAMVSFVWRGWWILGDILAGDDANTYEDGFNSLLVGAIGMALLTLTPLSDFLLDDGAALVGG